MLKDLHIVRMFLAFLALPRNLAKYLIKRFLGLDVGYFFSKIFTYHLTSYVDAPLFEGTMDKRKNISYSNSSCAKN